MCAIQTELAHAVNVVGVHNAGRLAAVQHDASVQHDGYDDPVSPPPLLLLYGQPHRARVGIEPPAVFPADEKVRRNYAVWRGARRARADTRLEIHKLHYVNSGRGGGAPLVRHDVVDEFPQAVGRPAVAVDKRVVGKDDVSRPAIMSRPCFSKSGANHCFSLMLLTSPPPPKKRARADL